MLKRSRIPLSAALVALLCVLLLVDVSGPVVRAAAPPAQTLPYRVGYISNQTTILKAAKPGARQAYRALPSTVGSSVDAEAAAGGDPARGTAGLVWVSKRANTPGGVRQPGDIWYLAEGSGKARRLTNDTAADHHPVLSPDGRSVAFDSARGGNTDIWVVDLDGSPARRITDSPVADSWPAFSPDGRSLAFTSTRDDPRGDIYIASLDGARRSRLTANPAADTQPAWSPGGDRIAFTTTRYRHAGDVALIAPGGGEVNRAVPDAFDSAEPAWSADGTRLAFSTRRDDRYGDVYEVDVASGKVTAVSANPWVGETHPAWRRAASSGGGEDASAAPRRCCCCQPPGDTAGSVVFTTLHRGQTSDVWSADSSGGDRRDHTLRPDASEADPAYTADGTRLAYTEYPVRSGVGSRVIVADAEGRGPAPLTPELPPGVAQREPAWSPDGTMIAFAEIRWTADGRQECSIRIVRVADGADLGTIPIPEPYAGSDSQPAWSPDGTRIALVRDAVVRGERSAVVPRIWVVTLTRPAPDRIVVTGQADLTGRLGEPCAGGNDRGPAWSPDGSALAFQHGRGICVADARSGEVRWFLQGRERSGDLRYPAWSPDGRRIAFSDCPPDGSSRRIWTVPASGGQPSTLIQTPGSAEQPAFRTLPELVLTGTASPPGIRFEGTTTLEFRVTNRGSGTAPDTALAAGVSSGLRPTQVRTTGGSCVLDGLRCTIGAVPAGRTVVVRISATGVRPGRQAAEAVAATGLPEAAAGENRVRVTVDVAQPGEPSPGTRPTGSLSVMTSSVTPVTYVGGANVVVTYTVRNGVNRTMPAVRMTIRLPRALPRPTDVFPRACAPDGRSCAFGSFAPGERVVVRLTFPARRAVNGVVSATVGSTGPDATRADNTARARVEVRRPVLRVNPAMGPPGFVTRALGSGLPPGARIRLSWAPGISEKPGIVRVRPDGTIDAQALIFHHDLLGYRRLRATPVDGPRFGAVFSQRFLVVARAVQPPFLTRD